MFHHTPESLYEKYNGQPSSYPSLWFRRRGLEVPDWALECSRLCFKQRYYANLDKSREYLRNWFLKYKQEHRNSEGVTLAHIRVYSRRYMVNELGFDKIKGYDVHHCFGYDDHKRFIYVPKALHHAIHSFLRHNKIDALTDHYEQIKEMLKKSRVTVYLIDDDEVKQLVLM